ncbi:MAG: AAA-like domain-containing protein, partial [Cyanobacteria bacterium P01_F01_bin.42]
MCSYSPYRHLGGSVPLDDSTFLTRSADRNLYTALASGEFCYVLTSRQMGKSSLRVRVMQQLQAEGKACGVVDLSAIGTEVTVESWYKGIAYRTLRGFRQIKSPVWKQWWSAHEFLSPIQQLSECIDSVLLDTIAEDIVLFIDEIDTVLSCGFGTDDFFSWIRACYNRRVDEPKYRRLTFCLIGVATPGDLIADRQRTPFNIGRAIALQGFEFEQARQALLPGLEGSVTQPERVLKQILAWTGGQPFLTQKVCQLVIAHAEDGNVNVEAIITTHIIQNWESNDEPEHLKTIRDRLHYNPDTASRVLGLYQQILKQGKLTCSDTPELRELRLTGIVAKQNNDLAVFNPIYQTIFNLEWVEQALASIRPYAIAFQAWVSTGETEALIQGEELVQAKAWAANKSLSDQDYAYLAACQEEAQRSVEEDLESSTQSNAILSVANAKANRRIRWGLGVLGVAGVILASALFFSGRLVRYAQIDAAKEREIAQQDREDAALVQKEALQRVQLLQTESIQIQEDLQAARQAKSKADQDLKALQDSLKLAQSNIQAAMKRVEETNRQAQTLEQQNQRLEEDSQK